MRPHTRIVASPATRKCVVGGRPNGGSDKYVLERLVTSRIWPHGFSKLYLLFPDMPLWYDFDKVNVSIQGNKWIMSNA